MGPVQLHLCLMKYYQKVFLTKKQKKKGGGREGRKVISSRPLLNVKKIAFPPVYEYLRLLILDLYQRLKILLQHSLLTYLSLAFFLNVSFITRHRLNMRC